MIESAPVAEVPIAARDSRLVQCLVDYPSCVSSERLYRSVELMERYSIERALELFECLNLTEHLRHWRDCDAICQSASLTPRFCFALGWVLERLAETGSVEARTADGVREYRIVARPRPGEPDRAREALLLADPANRSTVDLLDLAAHLYPAVARTTEKADDVFLGPKGATLWLNYFSNDNPSYAVNNWISATAAAVRLMSHSRLRILEVGAGAGSATSCLLQTLDGRGLLSRLDRYVVTEPNPFFRRRAQRDLASRHDKLRFAALDMNAPWTDQGINPAEFDLVYAVNVVHVAKDLAFTLGQARASLANNGWLVAGECLRPFLNQPLYPELIFQILESFTDVKTDPALRPNHGFLTAEQWRRALRQAGFARIEIAPDTDAIREFYRHFFTGAICGQPSTS